MKKFSAFLKEAKKSLAAQEAEKLQLTHVGYGKFADVRGNVTHMSQGGKLVKVRPIKRYICKGQLDKKKKEVARIRSIKARYLLHLEDLIHLLLGMKLQYAE